MLLRYESKTLCLLRKVYFWEVVPTSLPFSSALMLISQTEYLAAEVQSDLTLPLLGKFGKRRRITVSEPCKVALHKW